MDIYFITRRYIDNDGDIYELYDYVNSHPELVFLKEAEKIYPKAFKLIQERRLPYTCTDYGMYSYLAYLEVLEKHGYANVAMLGMAANQYARMAYYKRDILSVRATGSVLSDYPKYTQNEVDEDIGNALAFAKKAEVDISKILKNETKDQKFQPIDIVYGAEQYASVLRCLEAMGVDASDFSSPRDIFNLATQYSYDHVPEPYLQVTLSNAVTMSMLGESNSNEIRNAIYPFLDIRNFEHKQSGIVDKVIRARVEGATTRWFSLLAAYSQRNIIALGRVSPEFKAWLISSGWKESDF